MRAWARRFSPDTWDISIAAAMAVLAVLVLVGRLDGDAGHDGGLRPDDLWLWLGTAVAVGCLRWRRRRPVASYLLCCCAITALEVAHYRNSVPFAANAFGIYAVGAYARGWRRWVGPAAAGTAVAVVLIGRPDSSAIDAIANVGVLLGGSWLIGVMVANRRDNLAAEVAQARLRVEAAAQEAELAATNERLRIAQELHDVVAHSMSVIAVQAGVGAHLQESQPQEARRAVEAIAGASRQTLRELRTLLSGLRDDEPPQLQPAVADLDRLLAPLRAHGLEATLDVEGDTARLPPGVALAVYRIVQEAATNVLKHANATSVTVEVRAEPGTVGVGIRDNGRPTGQPSGTLPGGGNGLVGMRERVATYGGEFRAGPAKTGGFAVEARLPYGESATVSPPVADPTPIPAPIQPVRRWSGLVWQDALLAAAVTAGASLVLVTSPNPADRGILFRPTDAVAWLLTVGVCATLAGRRRWPLGSLAAGITLLVVLTAAGYPTGLAPAVPLIALYSVGVYGATPRRVWFGLGWALAGLALAVASDPPELSVGGGVMELLFFGTAALVGVLVRRNRVELSGHLTEANATLAAHARRAELARANERLRITRELHDVVAHSLSVIAVQAGTASHLAANDPAAVGPALDTISQLSRSTLTELRRILGVLRSASGDRALRPAPGLGDLADLVRQTEAAGVQVSLQMIGDRGRLPGAVDRSAYRLVQEALTNVVRHAGPARASVTVECTPTEVRIDVSDDGRGAAARAAGGQANGEGQGLTAMGERVAVFGGQVQAGPRTGGGYRVTAHLPYDVRSLEEVS